MKLKNKLLVNTVAIISMSTIAFATCKQDVDMGENKLLNIKDVNIYDANTTGNLGTAINAQSIRDYIQTLITNGDLSSTSTSNNSPVITSSNNTQTSTLNIIDVNAYDPDGDTIHYSITDGSNVSLFSIDAVSGILRFIALPTPGNYYVTVRVTDTTGKYTEQTINIRLMSASNGACSSPGGLSLAKTVYSRGETITLSRYVSNPEWYGLYEVSADNNTYKTWAPQSIPLSSTIPGGTYEIRLLGTYSPPYICTSSTPQFTIQ